MTGSGSRFAPCRHLLASLILSDEMCAEVECGVWNVGLV